MPSPTDEELVARVVVGRDMNAFGELIRRHQSQLRGWLRQLCRESSLADDLAQDTFIKAFDKLHSFSGTGRFQSWLFQVGYTTFLQWRRRSKRSAEILEQLGSGNPQLRDHPPELETNVELHRLLSALRPEERQIMVLCYGFGFSHREIGDVLSMPLGTVKSHIHRSKARLRQQFDLGRTGT